MFGESLGHGESRLASFAESRNCDCADGNGPQRPLLDRAAPDLGALEAPSRRRDVHLIDTELLDQASIGFVVVEPICGQQPERVVAGRIVVFQ